MSDDALQAAFLKMMGKAAPVKWETVDMAKRLRELQLDTHFPVELWPSNAATGKLATKFKTASRGDPSFNPCVCTMLPGAPGGSFGGTCRRHCR